MNSTTHRHTAPLNESNTHVNCINNFHTFFIAFYYFLSMMYRNKASFTLLPALGTPRSDWYIWMFLFRKSLRQIKNSTVMQINNVYGKNKQQNV